MTNLLWMSLLAQDTAADPNAGGRMVMSFLMMGGFLAILYFMMLRPQMKREKDRRSLVDSVKKNDRVVTAGGIHGVVTNIKDNEVVLKVDEASNVKIKFDKATISRILNAEGSNDSDAKDKK